MNHSWRWLTQEGDGVEHFTIHSTDGGTVADGIVVARDNGKPFGCSYTICCDARWRVRHVDVKVAGGAQLVLRADGEGRRSGKDGDRLPQLDGCIDVDLTCTPFTNTLPIRRLDEALLTRQEITVAYITLPEASVTPSRQAYTKLTDNRYLFESLSNPFRAEIETDAEGFVLHYPGLFDRAG